ncbi:MAG TPA: BTAD domain-containing putative transcriptional regulator [Actinophytocola sp.]|uniref:AfsR/SARP family transcriptional regulator n=1 Tax=Actinophytocola sp. TaxID=1872138 RepID=UPI002DB85EA3|nr:BTAD domain-containing putative transcriptional regulator [Actinophytocola sp.]HEU5469209.1 BTAD domain-containing putative transcriptional regulator [Actinophytocola sp.]
MVRVGGRRERTMLAVLLLAAGRLVPIERLIDAVWGDAPPTTARRQVHNAASELRRALGGLLVTREPGYQLVVRPEAVDLRVFDARVMAARQNLAEGRLADAAAGFHDVLRLWRGPALSGVTGLAGEAARLEERRLTVLADRIDAELALGRHADLVDELAGLAADHPLRERFCAQLMLALYRCGRRAEALQVYRDARRALVEGLGLDPHDELRRLQRAMLTGDPCIDLAPASTSGPPVAPCLLPADIADFTGRADEVDRLRAVLARAGDDAVVVSALAGRGGVGKTVLAVHVAHGLRASFREGQLYVNLRGGQVDPGEVLGRFLRTLGVADPALPATLDERAELYRNRLAGRRILVLLDDAGGEAQVDPLLPGGPGSAVVVTSRARLAGLVGAHRIELDVPTRAEALTLLGRIVGADRVAAEPRAARQLVDLCARLPLAVRIAGARLAARPHWRLADLAVRLSDERQRLDELTYGSLAVRTSLELSVRGLDPDARRLFHRLGSVQAPDFADWIGAALLDLPRPRAQELAERLVDARLLEAVGRDDDDQMRYRFHDLVRDYARERAEAEETSAQWRAVVATTFGGRMAPAEGVRRRTGLPGPVRRRPPRTEPDSSTWLETERLAVVAAVRRAAELALDELAWDLGKSCVSLFATRWYLDDWGLAIDHALAATRRSGNRRGQAATLYCQAALLDAKGSYESAMSSVRQARHLFEAAGDRHGHGLALVHAAHLARRLGRWEFALAAGEQGRADLHAVGDRAAEGSAVCSLAQTRLALGQPDLVAEGLSDALDILSGTGNRRDHAQVLHSVAELHFRRGMFDQALEAFGQVLRVAGELDDKVGEVYARHGVGACQLRRGQHTRAEAELVRALSLARNTGLRFVEARVHGDLAELSRVRGRAGEAAESVQRAAELWRTLKAPRWQARALRRLSDVRHAAGDNRGANQAWAQAQSLLSALGADSEVSVVHTG